MTLQMIIDAEAALQISAAVMSSIVHRAVAAVDQHPKHMCAQVCTTIMTMCAAVTAFSLAIRPVLEVGAPARLLRQNLQPEHGARAW